MASESGGLGPIGLLRLMVGTVFLSEGIQKFLFPADLGVGRFTRIGIPFPQITAPFVGAVEIAGGLLVIVGVFELYAAAALLVDISVALVSTKLPILLGRAVGPFALLKLPAYGLWSALHEARTDWCMLLGCLAIILASRSGATGRRR